MSADSARSPRRSPNFAVALILVMSITVAGLAWAKWWPYTFKLDDLLGSRSWSGSSILKSAGRSGAAPSPHGGWEFTLAYGRAIWKALVVALVVASAVDALVPRHRLLALLARRGRFRGSVAGGLLSIPCMMCTCCTAPIAGTLRRNGAPTSSVLAYWLGNPTLNPAVLAFLALVAPWQWFVTRLLVGAVLVFGVTVVVDRLTGGRPASRRAAVPETGGTGTGTGTGTDTGTGAESGSGDGLRSAPYRFARTLTRMTLTLVPEYAIVVFAVGAFRGWLFPFHGDAAHWGIVAVVLAAVLGTLVVIPTAGEIPILQGFTAVGANLGVVGALLITLPAISLPSMAMVVRDLSWRVTAFTAAAVAVAGIVSAVLLWAIA